MKQQSLTGFEKYGKTARRAQLSADMDKIIPWPELAATVQTAYPEALYDLVAMRVFVGIDLGCIGSKSPQRSRICIGCAASCFRRRRRT